VSRRALTPTLSPSLSPPLTLSLSLSLSPTPTLSLSPTPTLSLSPTPTLSLSPPLTPPLSTSALTSADGSGSVRWCIGCHVARVVAIKLLHDANGDTPDTPYFCPEARIVRRLVPRKSMRRISPYRGG